MKLPLLFEHYEAHKTADKNLTPVSFFYEHYIVSNPGDPDYLADMQLPFKSHNEGIAINLSSLRCIRQPHQELSLLYTMNDVEKNYSSYQPEHFTSAYLAHIWQPPRHTSSFTY